MPLNSQRPIIVPANPRRKNPASLMQPPPFKPKFIPKAEVTGVSLRRRFPDPLPEQPHRSVAARFTSNLFPLVLAIVGATAIFSGAYLYERMQAQVHQAHSAKHRSI